MSYVNVAKTLYQRMVQDSPNQLSNYAKVLFHWDNFSKFLPHLHAKINGCYKNLSLTLDEIDWDDVYPHLLTYAQTTDPQDRRLPEPLDSLEKAQAHLLNYLGAYFVHLHLLARYRESNFLRAQTGSWMYKSNLQLAPRYPVERPYDEASINVKMLGNEERDQAMANYFVDQSPDLNWQAQARHAEKMAENYWTNGGWGLRDLV